jgi:hypothetical protein
VTLEPFLRGGGHREDGLKEYVGDYKPEQVIQAGEEVERYAIGAPWRIFSIRKTVRPSAP